MTMTRIVTACLVSYMTCTKFSPLKERNRSQGHPNSPKPHQPQPQSQPHPLLEHLWPIVHVPPSTITNPVQKTRSSLRNSAPGSLRVSWHKQCQLIFSQRVPLSRFFLLTVRYDKHGLLLTDTYHISLTIL
jgi:hypothetical protein